MILSSFSLLDVFSRINVSAFLAVEPWSAIFTRITLPSGYLKLTPHVLWVECVYSCVVRSSIVLNLSGLCSLFALIIATLKEFVTINTFEVTAVKRGVQILFSRANVPVPLLIPSPRWGFQPSSVSGVTFSS